MKNVCLMLSFLITTSSAFAKITIKDKKIFIEDKSTSTPLLAVNDMLKDKSISKLKTYDDGKIHLISFAKKDGPVKLYSVDEKGFIYDIAPFSGYTVTKINDKGQFEFAEVPNRKYTVSSKGFYLY